MRARGSAGPIIVALSLVLLLSVGCMSVGGGGAPITGSGPVITENRQAGPFDKIESGNGLRLVVSIGATPSVTVAAQQNILPLVTTTVTDNKLTTTLTGSVIGSSPITVTVVTPSLTTLTLHDGTSADATGLAVDSFALNADNGAHVSMSGSVASLSINADDGVFLQLGSLVATNATLDVSNGVTGEIHATGAVTGTASNGVLLSVLGGGTITVTTSGGAFVRPR